MISIGLRDAVTLQQAGDLAGAARLYKELLKNDPRDFHALHLLGIVHFQLGEFADAARLIGEATRINPASAEAWYNFACTLQKLKRDSEAVSAFDAAIRLRPGYLEAEFNRGTSLLNLRRNAEALAGFDSVLTAAPQDAEAWHNRGNALIGLKHFAEARESFNRALGLRPGIEYAKGRLIYSKLQCCDWETYEEDRKAIAAALQQGARVISPLEHMLISRSPAEQLGCAQIWAAKELSPPPAPLWQGEKYGHKRIRVAYLSADFRAHAVAYQIAGVIQRHDRNRFEIIGVSYGPDDRSSIRRRLAGAFDRFVDVCGKSDLEIAAMLRAQETDIAVDLTGHTLDGRPSILAHRPAPIQVSFLGFPGTSGAECLDYLIADDIVAPEQDWPYFSEKIVHLSGTFFPTDSDRPRPEGAPGRAKAGLPESAFVFCCFNAICKVAPETFVLWMRILREAENSVLWLPQPGAEAAGNLAREASARGIAPERIRFASHVEENDDHLARLALADLFLDTLPYNAHSTAADALWAGVPVLTCRGSTFAGRVAASLLSAAGLSQLVTETPKDYEAVALRLARDPEMLATVKALLKKTRDSSPLFDTAYYCRQLEAGYADMHERHNRGQPPAPIRAGAGTLRRPAVPE